MADEARVRKVQERILQTVASMIGRDVKDPRLELVTITDVRVTGDLQHASVFYTVLGDDEQREKAARAFASAQGLFRSRVGKVLGLRLTPSWSSFSTRCPRAPPPWRTPWPRRKQRTRPSPPRPSAPPTRARKTPTVMTTRTRPTTRNGPDSTWPVDPIIPAPASS